MRDDLFLCLQCEPVLSHSAPQLGFDFFHTFFRPFEAHRSAEVFGFTTCEVRRHHCDAQQLFLKQWHSQSSFQNRFERRMSVRDRLLALPPIHVGMHHLSDNRAGPNDGYLYHEIVELHWRIARQRRHLRAAFHLEHSNRVRLAQGFIDRRIVGRKLRQVDRFAVVLGNKFQALFEHGHHAESQQIDFDDTHVSAIVLVPLHDDAARHRCWFEWNN